MSSPSRNTSNVTFIIQPTHIDDASDAEDEDWVLRGRYNRRRATRTNLLDGDNSDSDGEPAPQQQEPATISDLRRQIRQEAIQGDVSEADQATFEEYFGDRYRRPTSPTGRGWQNTARIDAGARISNRIYGPSTNAIRNTTLIEPALVSAGPPAGLCPSRRVQQQRIDAQAEGMRQIREADREMRVHRRDQLHQASSERLANECEDALRDHRRLSDLDVMRSELNARATAFREQDPAGFEGWADHITVAHACSTSKSRQHQIIQWYTRGVPGRVIRQVRRVERYYTIEAYLEERLLKAQVHTGARRVPDMRHHPMDDERWAGNSKGLVFGYDPAHSVNGFSDYIPKGEGVAIIKHCTANFAARKVRLQHASAQHLPVLVDMMESFVGEARAALERAERASAGDPELRRQFDRASDPISEYRVNPPQYQPERQSSSSVAVVRGADGNDGDESDGSDVAPIIDEFEHAAILLEATGFTQRLLANELLMDRLDGIAAGDEEDAGEDEDGDAAMDLGSSP